MIDLGSQGEYGNHDSTSRLTAWEERTHHTALDTAEETAARLTADESYRVEALEQKIAEFERRLEGINVMIMVRFAEATEIEAFARRVDALSRSQQ